MSKVIFLRHGVRQVDIKEPTKPLSIKSDCVLQLAAGSNLNITGYTYSLEVGKFIKRKIGIPDIIYADISTSRTIDTAIALAQGSNNEFISVVNDNNDPYFNPETKTTEESIKQSKEILKNNDKIIQSIKEKAEKILPCLTLEEKSYINKKNNAPLGLINQEYTLSTTMLFAEVSGIKDPLLMKRNLIASIQPINWLASYPNRDTIKDAAKFLLGGVQYFLDNYKLSVIVGHHHNINMITQYYKNSFQVPEFPEYWVPPNSGLIFTVYRDKINIEILYLNKNRFKIIPYMEIDNIKECIELKLIKKRVNYVK